MKQAIPDKEELTVTMAKDGSLTFKEYVSGHPSQIGYGEDEHATYLLLDSANARRLKEVLAAEYTQQCSEEAFWQTVVRETEFLADLLDVCDTQQIRYTYKSLGSESDFCLREFH